MTIEVARGRKRPEVPTEFESASTRPTAILVGVLTSIVTVGDRNLATLEFRPEMLRTNAPCSVSGLLTDYYTVILFHCLSYPQLGGLTPQE